MNKNVQKSIFIKNITIVEPNEPYLAGLRARNDSVDCKGCRPFVSTPSKEKWVFWKYFMKKEENCFNSFNASSCSKSREKLEAVFIKLRSTRSVVLVNQKRLSKGETMLSVIICQHHSVLMVKKIQHITVCSMLNTKISTFTNG